MDDCGKCVYLSTNVLWVPSEVGGSTLLSDGVHTLGRYEGGFPWSGGVCGGGGGWYLDGISQDLCHLQVRVKDRGPKRE